MIHVRIITPKHLKYPLFYRKIQQIRTFTQQCYQKQIQNHTNIKPLNSTAWNVLFFGTDKFALASLQKLQHEYRSRRLLNRLEVVTSYKGCENEVTKFAKDNSIKIHQWPLSIDITDFHIGMVVSFGHLIPTWIIQSFPLGIINVHASLLPKWRGAAPIIYSLMHGDSHTGVTIMKIMPKRFDVGEILIQETTAIDPDENQPQLYNRLATMGADLLIQTLKQLPEIINCGKPQSEMNVTYAPKVTRRISIIKWHEMTAKNVYNLQRALTGIFPLTTNFRGTTIKLYGIKLISCNLMSDNSTTVTPGLVLYDKKKNLLIVQCKDGNWVSIDEISLPNRRKMGARDFHNGFMINNSGETIFETTDCELTSCQRRNV